MTIEYGNSEFTLARRVMMVTRERGLLCPRGRYYRNHLIPILGTGFAAIAAFVAAGSSLIFLVLGCLLIGGFLELLYRWRSYDAWLHELFYPTYLNAALRRLRLEIADDGLREHDGDIVLFAPWKDVSDTVFDDDLLVIKLSSSQAFLVPQTSFGISVLDLDEIRNEIEQRRRSSGQSVVATRP